MPKTDPFLTTWNDIPLPTGPPNADKFAESIEPATDTPSGGVGVSSGLQL